MLDFNTRISANVCIEGKDITASEQVNGNDVYDIINKAMKCSVMKTISELCTITEVNITINTKRLTNSATYFLR